MGEDSRSSAWERFDILKASDAGTWVAHMPRMKSLPDSETKLKRQRNAYAKSQDRLAELEFDSAGDDITSEDESDDSD